MIGYLKGTLLQCTPERALLDVQGVGYAVSIPLPTFYELEKIGSEQPVGLFIHTHVREDAIELFGFWDEKEKLLFEKLISVSGIGPKLARVILSGMPSDQLLAALAGGDTPRLATIPGISFFTLIYMDGTERFLREVGNYLKILFMGELRTSLEKRKEALLDDLNLMAQEYFRLQEKEGESGEKEDLAEKGEEDNKEQD